MSNSTYTYLSFGWFNFPLVYMCNNYDSVYKRNIMLCVIACQSCLQFQEGATPLAYAAASGHSDVVKMLHDFGADFNQATKAS